jgi:hypothetical protein
MTVIDKIGIALTLLIPWAAHAAPQSVTESAQYVLTDNESKNDARQICASTAKRTALDKAGSLFESDLITHKSEASGSLADDTRLQMRSYVAAVVGSEVVGERFDMNNDRLTVSCTVRITFDPDEVSKKLQDIEGNVELRQKLAAQQAQMDILNSQIRTLRAEVASSKADHAALAQSGLSGAPPAIPDPAFRPSAPAPQVAQVLPAAPSSVPPPQYLMPQPYSYAAVPAPVPPPTYAQFPYQTVTVYPPPMPIYYYYRVPVYGARIAYAPRFAYARSYYASRRQW